VISVGRRSDGEKYYGNTLGYIQVINLTNAISVRRHSALKII
jgi:hypothetical protein